MPNGSAAPADVVLLTGFSGTGDSTRDSAVRFVCRFDAFLAFCITQPFSVDLCSHTEQKQT